ncbi:MAG: GNAT family N-acetyltransferase [Pseudomonadota bacterium]
MAKPSEISIRPLAWDDREEWSNLWSDYLAFYETSVSDEIKATYFGRLLGNDPQDFNALVAVDGARLVGLVHYLFHRHGWIVANTCYLQDLYARPDVRGRGIGRALIEAVYAAADAAGAAKVYWQTQHTNRTARQLYDRVGQLTPFIVYQRGATA